MVGVLLWSYLRGRIKSKISWAVRMNKKDGYGNQK